jgi:ribosomal protein L23
MADKKSKENKPFSLELQPLQTEKALQGRERTSPVYVFSVPVRANKAEVRKEISRRFGVKPLKVRISCQHRRINSGRGGRRAAKKETAVKFSSRTKKALVFLRSGETIKITV